MKLRTLALLALAAATPALHAQEPLRIRLPARTPIELPGGAVIDQYGDHWTIWFKAPDDVTPTPKPVDPIPKPPDPPQPQPPAWGPLVRAFTLYERDHIDGREVFHGLDYVGLLSSIVQKDGNGQPLWRQLDDDAAVTEIGWAEAREQLRAKRAAAVMDPILYLFDAEGRVESINLSLDATPTLDALRAKLKALGVALP